MSDMRAAVLDAIRDLDAENGWPPTVREIAAKVGLASSSTVAYHLAKLEAEGLLRRGHSGRAYALLGVTCGICGVRLDDRRSDARYCSPTHRHEAWRRRRGR